MHVLGVKEKITVNTELVASLDTPLPLTTTQPLFIPQFQTANSFRQTAFSHENT
jgi:hypothetical protein